MHCSEKKPLLSGSGQPRRLSNLGMSASTPTPDVSLQRSEPTLRANNGREQLFEDLVSAAASSNSKQLC
jgi:hypothetical protein